MPKFNMSWIYILVLVGLIGVYFASGSTVGENSSASKEMSYEQFKTLVAKGYASKIVVNKTENSLKMSSQSISARFSSKAHNKWARIPLWRCSLAVWTR